MSGTELSDIYQWSQTPYLAWLNGAMLITTPVVSPATQTPVSVMAQKQSMFSAFTRPRYFGPTKTLSLMFGLANAIGGFMIYDGDLESGTGFLAAWNSLYLLVGGRGSVKAMRYGKVWPLLLTTVSASSAALYGRRFVASGFQ